MRGAYTFAAAALAAFVGQTVAHPIVAHPGGIDDISFTTENVLNSTTDAAEYNNPPPGDDDVDGKVHVDVGEKTQASNSLPVSLVNNYGDGMYAWMSGKDSSGIPVFIDITGNYFYPTATGGGVPDEIDNTNLAMPLGAVGSTVTWNIPGDLQSGRIYIAQGQLVFYTVIDGNGVSAIVEPAPTSVTDASSGIQWGFVELNYFNNAIYTNISYVDFVGLSLGMALSDASNTQVVQGLVAGAVASICSDMQAQAAADGLPWDELCTVDANGAALRVLSPNLYTSAHADWMPDYYNDYVSQVWSTYATQPLSIDTQEGDGTVTCQVSGDELQCSGDNRGYPAPTTADIWGCNSGPFAKADGDGSVHIAVIPRLCAAFTRTTLLLEGGNLQPSLGTDSYYTTGPTNHYARVVHNYETDGIGYAFSYDDVAPQGSAVSGEISTTNPTGLKVTVGGYS